jgi:hypothetical protein
LEGINIVGHGVHLLGGDHPQILYACFQGFSELGGLFVYCLHFVIEVGQNLMHFFLLVVLHAFSKFVHYVDLFFGLATENKREERSFLLFEVASLVFPLLVYGGDLALVDKVSENEHQ